MSLNSNQLYSAPSKIYSTDYTYSSACTGAYTGNITFKMSKRNGIVFIRCEGIAGAASVSSGLNIQVTTPLLQIFRPATLLRVPIICTNNSILPTLGYWEITTNGTMQIAVANGFTGFLAVEDIEICYNTEM